MLPQLLPSPVSAVLSVEPGGTRLSAELAPVARLARAGAVGLVALPVHALAVALAVLPPQPLPALAAARELLAGAAVAGALGVAAAAEPAGLADAATRGLVAHGVDGAVTAVGTLRPPEAGVARALARLLVALAFLAGAGLLAVGPPAVGVARAFACHVVTFPVWVASAFSFAVRTPKLGGALWGKKNKQTDVLFYASCHSQHFHKGKQWWYRRSQSSASKRGKQHICRDLHHMISLHTPRCFFSVLVTCV